MAPGSPTGLLCSSTASAEVSDTSGVMGSRARLTVPYPDAQERPMRRVRIATGCVRSSPKGTIDSARDTGPGAWCYTPAGAR